MNTGRPCAHMGRKRATAPARSASGPSAPSSSAERRTAARASVWSSSAAGAPVGMVASPVEHDAAVALHLARQLGDQPGLADPFGTEHRDEPATARRRPRAHAARSQASSASRPTNAGPTDVERSGQGAPMVHVGRRTSPIERRGPGRGCAASSRRRLGPRLEAELLDQQPHTGPPVGSRAHRAAARPGRGPASTGAQNRSRKGWSATRALELGDQLRLRHRRRGRRRAVLQRRRDEPRRVDEPRQRTQSTSLELAIRHRRARDRSAWRRMPRRLVVATPSCSAPCWASCSKRRASS